MKILIAAVLLFSASYPVNETSYCERHHVDAKFTGKRAENGYYCIYSDLASGKEHEFNVPCSFVKKHPY